MNPEEQSLILVVDDNRDICELVSIWLEQEGHTVLTAFSGTEGLAKLQSHDFDVVILDIMMPGMNGYEVLEYLKANSDMNHLPVIVISALGDIDSVIRCVQLGAEDYLFKPINPVLLKARLDACLEKKRLRDKEQAYLKQLQAERAKLAAEQERSERLLLNILPKAVADQLKRGQQTIADSFTEVTVLFADIVDFTRYSAHISPAELVNLLNQIFSMFDRLAEEYHLEKIKTIGDAYMVVAGLPTPREDHAEAIAEMALNIQALIGQFSREKDKPFQMRIGINTGPVVAGVIGTTKFTYDLWGDTVNIASRMESHGIAGRIQVSATTYQRLCQKYIFEERGLISVKGKGKMPAYLLIARNK